MGFISYNFSNLAIFFQVGQLKRCALRMLAGHGQPLLPGPNQGRAAEETSSPLRKDDWVPFSQKTYALHFSSVLDILRFFPCILTYGMLQGHGSWNDHSNVHFSCRKNKVNSLRDGHAMLGWFPWPKHG